MQDRKGWRKRGEGQQNLPGRELRNIIIAVRHHNTEYLECNEKTGLRGKAYVLSHRTANII